MNLRRGKITAAVAIAAVAAGGAAVCQSANGAPARPAATLKLSASKSALKFNVSKLTAKHGKITLRMSNPSSFQHAIGIQGKGKGKVVNKGGTSTFSATLKKGKYTFYCPVGNHAAAGMKGTLTVT
jgi:plastocyanin